MVYLCRYLLHRGFVPVSQTGMERILRCSSTCGCHQYFRGTHTDSRKSSELWFDLDKLETMNRRDLAQLCKKCGVRANSKTTRLVSDLKEFHAHHLTDSTSILHSSFTSPNNAASFAPVKGDEKVFPPSGLKLDKNNSLFTATGSPSLWITGEVNQLHKAVKSKGIFTKSVREEKGDTNGVHEGQLPVRTNMYLAKTASVSTILNSTARRPGAFSLWQKRQIEKMGEEMFSEYKRLLLTSGKKFHSCMTDILQKKVDEAGQFPDIVSGLVKSVSKTGILKLLTENGVLATEAHVTHSSIGYSGTFDGLAVYNGVPCLIEWKTAQNPRPTLESCYDTPLQVVAYAGAVNSKHVLRIPVTSCMIVVAHHDGSEADVHWMDLDTCEKFWQGWLIKVLKYKQKMEDALEQSNVL